MGQKNILQSARTQPYQKGDTRSRKYTNMTRELSSGLLKALG